MFILKKEKDNIKSFAVGNQTVLGNSKFSVQNLDENLEILKSDIPLQEIYFSDPYFYISDFDGNSFLIEENQAVFLENIFMKEILSISELLVSSLGETKIYNIKNQSFELLFQSRIFTRLLNNNYLFFEDNLTICNFSLLNKSFLWHFDLSQFGKWKNFENKDRDYEVEQLVGIANNCLYVLLSNFKLIALDVENGDLVQQLNLGEQFTLEDRNWLSNSSKMHLDEVNNRMIWLTSATLLHIDLETFKANLIKDYFNVPLENLWRFKRSNFQEQQLLFTAQNGREAGDPDTVGIMNPDSGEILWQYQITETQGLYEEPQLANNKLYVKSLDDILYIFEKE